MKVLLVVTNVGQIPNTDVKTGWYLPEAAHPYKVFKEAKLDVIVVSPLGGKAPLDAGSAEAFKDDPVCKEMLADKEFTELFDSTTAIANIDLTDHNVIFFVGGHGPMFDLPDCDIMNKATRTIYNKGGIVGGVCHGVVGLLNVNLPNGQALVKDQKLTSFTDEEEDMVKMSSLMPFMLQTALVKKGADFVAGKPFETNVQKSDRILTGQNPASGGSLATAIVEKMKELKFC